MPKKPDKRLITPYGKMNRVSPPLIESKLDSDSSTTMERLSRMAKDSHLPDVFVGGGPYRAQVLRVEGRGLTSDTPEHDVFVGEQRDISTELVRVKARIPELHAGLPIPSGLGDADGDFQKIIDMYPTFTAQDNSMSPADISVGDPVWVNFVDKINYRDGVLVGAINPQSSGKSGTAESPSASREGACAGNYGKQGAAKPSGDSLPAQNKPKSHSGAPMKKRRPASTMTGEFGFITDGSLDKKTTSLWEKSSRAKSPAGKSLWAQLDDLRTLIFCPNITVLTKPKEYIWLFPPLDQNYNSDFFNSIALTAKRLSISKRNYILIMCLPRAPRLTGLANVARLGSNLFAGNRFRSAEAVRRMTANLNPEQAARERREKIAQDQSVMSAWSLKVQEKLDTVFAASRKEEDVDSYISIGSGIRNLINVPWSAEGAHLAPKNVLLIKPTGQIRIEFLRDMQMLANHHTVEDAQLPSNYTLFDFNLLVENRREIFKALEISALRGGDHNYFQEVMDRVYREGNPPTERDPRDGQRRVVSLPHKHITIFEKPQIDGYELITFISDRHDHVAAMKTPVGDAQPSPAGNDEEAEENLAEQQAGTTTTTEQAKPPTTPAAESPPPKNGPTPPSARPKNSSIPKRAAKYEAAKKYTSNRVRVKDYGVIKAEQEGNLLAGVPNTKGGNGRVKLHVLAAARFNALRQAAAQAGFADVKLASGYRRHRWKSRAHYNEYVTKRYGSVAKGRKFLAYASPHETGLALDFGNHGLEPKSATIARQKRTPFFKWLKENAHKFGMTPYKTEPWHWEIRIPYNSWATAREFTDDYAVRVTNVGSKDAQIGDASSPVSVAKNSSSAPERTQSCVAKVGGTGTSPGGGRSAGSTVPAGKAPPPGATSTPVAHPPTFEIITGAPCNGCHRRKNKLQTLFVLHETGGHPKPIETLKRGHWAKHRKAGGKVDKEVHLWQGINGKFMQLCPLETNLPHANRTNKFSFGVEVAGFSSSAHAYGGPKPFVDRGLHIIGNPDKKKGRLADIHNPSKGFKFEAILVPQEVQFAKIWEFVKWLTTSEVPSSPGTKIDVPMNFPAIAKDGRFYFSPMAFGEPVKYGSKDAAKWSAGGLRGISAHARWNHMDGLPFEYYCIQRSKGADARKAFYATLGALCSMDARKGVPLLAPDSFAQLGLRLYPYPLNHPTYYTVGKSSWTQHLASYKQSYKLNIA